jgi:hypothetical protein
VGQSQEDRARQRERAVAAFEQLGGKVETDTGAPGNPVVKVSLRCAASKDADLVHLQAFPELRELNCEGCCKRDETRRLTDAGLKHLEGLSRLEYLNLEWHRGITDAGLEHLRGLTSLRELNLAATGVTEAGVRKLQESLPKARICH